MREKIIAANWKMNHLAEDLKKFFTELLAGYKAREEVSVVIAPASPYLARAAEMADGAERVFIAAQNMYCEKSGAFTGEISPSMVKDCGCRYVILGHSERRHIFGETDELIARKVKIALNYRLNPILCIGELLEEREDGKTEEVVSSQLNAVLPQLSPEEMLSVVVAYEPVWAIGTGRTATVEQAEEVHHLVRGIIGGAFGDEVAQRVTIQYGGSVKPENIDQLMAAPDIDGALVGGASLAAESFLRLINFKQ
ncbi:MAG: triose-phosphate isomerase [Candidatus Glassbacteria bacterium RIFCSPLOWO2_12_FULL_58_11]|uniref:Triosephosphate isomerase n=1 Tax=Candidatus Glassbacteria bacterium RIFCSPLOWO2_12_FULL_58_11 TaxID=1817867 RepID=A0A1F5YZA9_9BACT|nr:MAG: triose-phosphate isomerase [Candidatus Glassbacteria bacterium RIFCSPLOWO2_12_FULL_58_11]